MNYIWKYVAESFHFAAENALSLKVYNVDVDVMGNLPSVNGIQMRKKYHIKYHLATSTLPFFYFWAKQASNFQSI